MKSIKELKEELAKLKAEQEVKEDFIKRNAEQKKLSRQLWEMKHPNLKISKDIVKEGLGKIGTGVAKFGSNLAKKQKRKKKSNSFDMPKFKLPKFKF